MVCVICLEMAENVRLTGSTKLEQIKEDICDNYCQ